MNFRVDAFQNISDEYIYKFLEREQDVITGKYHAFDEVYAPRLRAQGVNAVNMAVGGERCVQVLYSDTDVYRFWDAHKKLDILNSDLEGGAQSFILIRSAADIDQAQKENKIAVFATLAGGRPLQGKANLNLLSSLRSLYRMGLRSLQLTGNNRNRLADGFGQTRTRGKLTNFGRQIVTECNRLGILLDTAQLSDYGFYDLVEHAGGRPVIDSHSCAAEISSAVSDREGIATRNLSDKRIKTIADTNGVIGVNFRAALVAGEKESATIDDLLRQIDHIVEIAGINHVALGPDYCSFKTPVDREKVIAFGNLGPDACDFDYKTPYSSEKYPGLVDGVWYGYRKNDFVEDVSEMESFSNIIPALKNHGYSEDDLNKLLGENMIRVYKEILG